jgi:hypothetical protein
LTLKNIPSMAGTCTNGINNMGDNFAELLDRKRE